MRRIVVQPDLEVSQENAKRRALLFIRHLSLWKELPADTTWFEVEVKDADLDHIRVFPRAQWRNLARGNFSIREVAKRMRDLPEVVEGSFLKKVQAIRERLLEEEEDLGTVILIGVSENEPLTILDGNHRLLAAMLASPSRVHKLKFLCGFSPQMAECCWYNTNLATLFRYGKNVLTHVVRDPEAELARLLQSAG